MHFLVSLVFIQTVSWIFLRHYCNPPTDFASGSHSIVNGTRWLTQESLPIKYFSSERKSSRSLINHFRQFCLWRQVTKEFRRSLARVIFDMKMFSQKYRDGTSVIVSVTVMKVYTWQNVPVTMYSVCYIALENNTPHYFAILCKNLYPKYVLNMLLHSYVTKAVGGNDTRPSTGVEQQ